ncbi:MAG: ABC transporter ATP-binding protein/permease [bacterium]|nr:ABC transporter ATP-binding protein/permease [bacterium]
MRKFKFSFFLLLFIFTIRTVLDQVVRTVYFKKIIDHLSVSGINREALSEDLYYLVGAIIFIIFLTTVAARSAKFIYFAFEINVIRELRNFCFKRIQNHSYTFFSNTFAGSLVTKSRRFVGSFETMFDMFLFNFFSTSIVLIGVFVVLVRESLTISMFFLAWVILYSLIIIFLLKKKVKYDLLEAEQDSKISGRLADVFGNISAVKFFSSREDEISSFGKYTDEGARRSKKAWFFSGRIELLQSVLAFIVQSIVLYVMIKLWIQGEITTGMVVLVQTYMLIVFEKLWDLGNAVTKFMKSAADMQEMIDILEITPDILDPKNPEKTNMSKGDVSFNNVCFKYSDGYEILNNFNLNIKSGERVGLVGHSGAGKSTLTKLILRLNDVTSGSITIDGQDIRNVNQDDLRRVVSYVPQEPILFHRPIRENIAYGKPEATDEEIIEVSKKAHAHEFISKLHQGYDTLVGERGVKLSGGERQRVAIARAMLKDSPVLILDEATSSLDSVSEHYIQDALNILMKGKTTLVVAHRLSTIQKMDRIIVLHEGKILEEGTHKELLEKNGPYAELWDHQTGGFLEE